MNYHKSNVKVKEYRNTVFGNGSAKRSVFGKHTSQLDLSLLDTNGGSPER